MSEMKQVLVAVTSLATISLLTVLTFQNCSKVGFQNNDELSLAGIDGEMRSVFLNPEAKEDRPNINITAVLDNSPSMQPIQDQVAQALSAVSSKVRGFDGKVEIYTTTQDSVGDGEKKPSYVVNEEIVYMNGTDEVRLPADQESSVPENMDYKKERKYSLSASYTPGGQPLAYSGSMDDSSFEAFQQSMSDAISNIGVGGSIKEQGLCTLLRAVDSKSSTSDFEVFLVAGNAKDETDLAGCPQLSTKEYTRAMDVSTVTEPCDSSDPDCKFRYKVTYDKKKKEKLEYKYLNIDRDISYTLEEVTGTYKINYKYDRHGAEYKYKRKKYTQTVFFKRQMDVDGLVQDDPTEYSHTTDSNKVGMCPNGVKNKESVSCSTVAGMIPSNKKGEGLINGTCKISCSEGLTGESKKGIHGYKEGLCSENSYKKGRETCSGSEKDDLASKLGISASLIGSCDVNCYENKNKGGDDNLSSRPGNCGDPCTGSQENDAVNDAPSYISSKSHLNSCTISCSESNVTGGINNYNSSALDSCPGKSASTEDSWNYSDCTDDMKDAILSKEGLTKYADIKDCSYKCEHDHQTGGISTYKNPSSCTLNASNDCNSAELLDAEADLLDDHGRPASRMVAGTCKNKCVPGSGKGDCTKDMTADNLCSGSTPLGDLAVQCDGGSFTYKSCQMQNSFKSVDEITYDTTEGSWQYQSYTDSADGFEETVANRLSSTFGNSFYLASFNVPTNDDSCKPDGPNIDPASRFEELHQKIGSDRGQFFPKCLPDYSDSLNFVLDLVVNYVEKTYIVDLNPEYEFVYRVTFYYKDGSIKRLDKSLYSASNKILAFDESVDLEPVERIHVEVVTERQKD